MIFEQFAGFNRTVTEARCGGSFEGAVGQCHVSFANRERRRGGERFLGRFDVRKEIVVNQKMPHGVCSFAFDCEYAEHSEAAFELKNQVVAGNKNVICQMKTAPLESGNSQ